MNEQIWVSLANNKLCYYDQKPAKGVAPKMKGFVIVNIGGQCNEANEHNSKEMSIRGKGKYCFIVQEPPPQNGIGLTVVFSATSGTICVH